MYNLVYDHNFKMFMLIIWIIEIFHLKYFVVQRISLSLALANH